MLTPSLATSGMLKPILADPAHRVFCAAPGDYRAAGRIDLWSSGSPGQPRVLRFHSDDVVTTAAQRTQQAIFEDIYVLGDWWVIQGLTIQPREAVNNWFVTIYGGDHVVIDGNLIDGADHPNVGPNGGVVLAGYNGDPATHNTVQRNVIRNGNRSRLNVDYWGVLLAYAHSVGDANDYNEILDNEIYDWSDGISLGAVRDDCLDPDTQRGTIIDGNDVYVTPAKRVDCTTGAADPNGACSCTEEGISTKAMPGPSPAEWTRITNNRVWGMRPTTTAGRCGGSGSNGAAIAAGTTCPRNTFVARNLIADSTIGISIAGPSWVVTGNLVHDVRASNGRISGTKAISTAASGDDLQIQFNTVVGADNGYDDLSSNTDTRCNVLVDDAARAGVGGTRGAGHSTEYNFLYQAPQPNIMGNTNEFYSDASESGTATYCYWRRRWTAPERVCVPHAATTPTSTHAEAAASCDTDLGAPFGEAPIGFVAAPEPAAADLAATTLLGLAALSRRRLRRA